MKSNRQVICYWGASPTVQVDAADQSDSAIPRIVKFPLHISRICCGQQHIVILSSENQVYMMGNNSKAQLGVDNVNLVYSKPTLLTKLQKHVVKSIAAGWFHNVVVTESGEVYSWGDDSSGALGYNPSFIDRHPKKVNTLCDQNEKITRAYCGARHTILQSEHDKLYGFGDNEQHQLGLQTKKKYFLPEKIPIDDRIISVACGTSHTLVLDCHYKIHATGLNNFGQLGIENGASVAKFTPIINQKRFISIKCGHHSAAISEQNELYLWGTGPFGQYFVPTKVLEGKVRRLWMGSTFGLAESYTGEIYSWGSNVSGQLGHGDCDTCTTIQKMPALPISSIEDIACGSHSVIAIGQTASDSSLQYLNGYQVHNQTLMVQTRRNKGLDVLLSEQKHLQSNYRLEKEHKKHLENINEDLRGRVSLLTEEIAILKDSNRQLTDECSGFRLKLQLAKQREKQMVMQLQNLRAAARQVQEFHQVQQQFIQIDWSGLLKEREQQIVTLQKEKMILEQQLIGRSVEQLTRQKDEYKALNEQLQIKQMQAEQVISEHKTMLEQINDKLIEHEKTIQSYILEVYSLKSSLSEKTRDHEELHEAFEFMSERVHRLEYDNTSLAKELSTTKLLSASMSNNKQPMPPLAIAHQLSQQQILRQNEIEIHNYKKLLLMKDRQSQEMRKQFNCHQQIETITPSFSVVKSSDSCLQSLKTIELLEESQNHLSMFRQLLRDIHDKLDQHTVFK